MLDPQNAFIVMISAHSDAKPTTEQPLLSKFEAAIDFSVCERFR